MPCPCSLKTNRMSMQCECPLTCKCGCKKDVTVAPKQRGVFIEGLDDIIAELRSRGAGTLADELSAALGYKH